MPRGKKTRLRISGQLNGFVQVDRKLLFVLNHLLTGSEAKAAMTVFSRRQYKKGNAKLRIPGTGEYRPLVPGEVVTSRGQLAGLAGVSENILMRALRKLESVPGFVLRPVPGCFKSGGLYIRINMERAERWARKVMLAAAKNDRQKLTVMTVSFRPSDRQKLTISEDVVSEEVVSEEDNKQSPPSRPSDENAQARAHARTTHAGSSHGPEEDSRRKAAEKVRRVALASPLPLLDAELDLMYERRLLHTYLKHGYPRAKRLRVDGHGVEKDEWIDLDAKRASMMVRAIMWTCVGIEDEKKRRKVFAKLLTMEPTRAHDRLHRYARPDDHLNMGYAFRSCYGAFFEWGGTCHDCRNRTMSTADVYFQGKMTGADASKIKLGTSGSDAVGSNKDSWTYRLIGLKFGTVQ
jgi:hypothetical protein